MKFTPNSHCIAKLTDHGKKLALDEWDRSVDALRARGSPYRPPLPFDDHGIVRGQFLAVCAAVGGYSARAGGDTIFEWMEVEA